MAEGRRVAIIGLDSVPTSMLFGKLLDRLPNLKRMYERGLHAELRSCDPPITIPAWMVMMTGMKPGPLGIYGFRHRKEHSYSEGYIVSSNQVREETVWEALGRSGKRSIVIGVPPGYPPKRSPNVSMVSCLLTPGLDKEFAYPPELKQEVLRLSADRYEFDVTFRTEDREELKRQLFEMTRRRFDVAEGLAKEKSWDFFMMHEIGFDRLHHAFWKYFDPAHPKFVEGNPYRFIDEEYYRMVDERIGRLLQVFGEGCLTFVLSDHGSMGMEGAFCVNQWLEKEGYLAFRNRPKVVTELDKADVDWGRTRAWGWGGYYARIFFNVKGREREGIIEPGDLQREKDGLASRLRTITDDAGEPMKNVILDPETLYGKAVGDKPDLMVYFDDLKWRSAGTVGHDSMYLHENDTGPDDSVHSMDGVFLMYDPKRDMKGKDLGKLQIQDIGPTLLSLYGLQARPGIDGRLIREVVEAW